MLRTSPALAMARPSRPGASAWGTDDARQRNELRAATAATVNADARTHRGLDHRPLRGLAKALPCATSFALTYDVLRLIALRG